MIISKIEKKKVAANFKATRVKNKLSQVAFAKKLGCSQGVISKIENKKTFPSLQLFLKLKKCFKVA